MAKINSQNPGVWIRINFNFAIVKTWDSALHTLRKKVCQIFFSFHYIFNWKQHFLKKMLNGNPLTDFKITFIISSFFHHIYVFFKPFVPEIWYKQSKVRFFLARTLQIIYRRALKTILELFLNLTFYKWVVKKSFQCISKSDNWIYCNQYEFLPKSGKN